MTLNSKAQNLIFLKNKAKKFEILPLLCFLFSEYKKNKNFFLNQIKSAFKSEVIVRSSAYNEDRAEQSNAGVYKSVLNVEPDSKSLVKAIDAVTKDYRNDEDEILIQPMLKDIWISGVMFTRDHATGAPYYIINYTNDGKTNTITSGSGQGKTIVISRSVKLNKLSGELPIKSLLSAVKEIERIYDSDTLDIEFAFDKQKKLYIFQVRPLIVQSSFTREKISDELFFDKLKLLYQEIKNNSRKNKLDGKGNIFSMMTDWNPAEMIGTCPNPLALSLYKALITDDIWAIQRKNYGYKNVAPYRLLHSFMGCPYIDVRTDFNSFIPSDLSKKTSRKITDYYLRALEKNPELHDKAEFSILFTAATLTSGDNIKEKFSDLLSPKQINEFLSSLRKITNSVFNYPVPLYKKDILSVQKLQENCKLLFAKKMSFEEKTKELLEACKKFGTLPFAGIARTAFIGKQFLDSFLEKKIITLQQYNDFICSIPIISEEIQFDIVKLRNKKITQKKFLEKWGHLRPSSYDILSLRYDEDFNSYFNMSTSSSIAEKPLKKNSFTQKQLQKIDELLVREGLNFSAKYLLNCIEDSILWRDKSKFIFTKILSHILLLIGEYAHSLSISKEDISYVSIYDLLEHFETVKEKKEFLQNKINQSKINYYYTKYVKLPEVFCSAKDIFCFEQNENIPNYVTQRKVKAKVICEEEIHNADCQNKIICIRAADPGYDFIFTKNIAGLITQFGGANSHMAIRCMEQNIPAVIGIGEKRFNELRKAEFIEIDALNKQLRIIR